MPITLERAERIARSHACEQCHEYSFKKIVVKPASEAQVESLRVIWVARRICGVCGMDTEMGLDDDGDIVFLG